MVASFVPLVGVASQWVNMVRCRRTFPVLYFFDGFMGKAYGEGFDMIFNYGSDHTGKAYDEAFDVIFNYGPGQRSQGQCRGALICILESLLKHYVPPCTVMLLGGSKTEMESSAAKNNPSQINRALCVPFHLP